MFLSFTRIRTDISSYKGSLLSFRSSITLNKSVQILAPPGPSPALVSGTQVNKPVSLPNIAASGKESASNRSLSFSASWAFSWIDTVSSEDGVEFPRSLFCEPCRAERIDSRTL